MRVKENSTHSFGTIVCLGREEIIFFMVWSTSIISRVQFANVLGWFIGQIIYHRAYSMSYAYHTFHICVYAFAYNCIYVQRERGMWYVKLYYNGFGMWVFLRNKNLKLCSSFKLKPDIIYGLHSLLQKKLLESLKTVIWNISSISA